MMRAMTMPIISTFCWYIFGTANPVMTMRNTNRLSIDRAFSVRYPAKYSPPYPHPEKTPTPTPNSSARPM